MTAVPRDLPHPPVEDVQSYGFRIYNKAFDKLAASSFFANFACKRLNRALPIDAGIQIPFLGVYLLDEQLAPDGDVNAGDIRFSNTVRIGFQVVVKNSDAVVMEAYLDRAYWFIMHNLLDDADFTNRYKSNIPGADNPKIEGINRGTVRRRWGVTGAKNETPVGELQLELAFFFRTEWSPWDFPYLDRITVTTGFPGPGATPEEQAQIQQVKMVYDFAQPKEGAPDAEPGSDGPAP